jgi:hypothetical protein
VTKKRGRALTSPPHEPTSRSQLASRSL